MKKVGIMTLHIGDNYGALLQCYALRRVLNGFAQVEADIINFDPGREFPVYESEKIQAGYQHKLEKFARFHQTYNGISGTAFRELPCEEAEGYDYYITGSDQVWNTSFVFAKEAYFLNFVPEGAKRIAYAPSIGIPENSPKIKIEWFQRNIPLFDHLSLRESSHKKFLSQFTDKEIHAAADPTLLLSAKDYDELCAGTAYPEGAYLVLYYLKHDNAAPLLIEFANLVSRKFHLKVVYSFADVMPHVFGNDAQSFYDADPREFVQLIKNAKAVITNSFHGTVFSLKYHVPFFTYLAGNMSSRVMDLLKEVGMEDRIVHGYQKLSDHMFEMDFAQADKALEEKKTASLNYLKMALDLEESYGWHYLKKRD